MIPNTEKVKQASEISYCYLMAYFSSLVVCFWTNPHMVYFDFDYIALSSWLYAVLHQPALSKIYNTRAILNFHNKKYVIFPE